MTAAQREDLERKIEATSRVASRLFEQYTSAQLTRRPREQAWSAAACIVHLSLTAAAAVPLVEATVADLRRDNVRRNGPSRMDLMGRMLRWSLEPPPRFRVKTTAPFEPVSFESLSAVLPEFLTWQRRMGQVVHTCEGLDLGARKVTSPFNSHVRYNVFAALCILETHVRRHLWQAEQALRA